jgi:transposase
MNRHHNDSTIAVAWSYLVIIYNVLKKGQSYQELGEDYQDKQPDKERLARRLLKRLEKLGVKVTLAAQEAVA